MQFQKILVPTDLSSLSLQAIPYGAALARAGQGTLILAYMSRSCVANAELRRSRVAFPSDVIVEQVVEHADAVSGIVDLAHRRSVDLIVMATHGRTGVSRRVMGSKAEAVVRYADCPVMVVRPALHTAILRAEVLAAQEPVALPIPVLELRKRPPTKEDLYFANLDRELIETARRKNELASLPALRVATILAPTDLTAASRTVLFYAAELANGFHAKVHVLHVAEINTDVYAAFTNRVDASDFEFPMLGALVEKLNKIEQSLGSACSGSSISFGHPRDAILAVARRLQADLIVMATHGRHGLSRMFFGSTTEGVVRRAPCPVVSVRCQKPSVGEASEDHLVLARK